MPPANSLQGTPPLSPAAPAPATSVQRSGVISPSVLSDFASTLINRPGEDDEDAHQDNVNFLRTNVRSSPDSSLSRQRRRRQQQQHQQHHHHHHHHNHHHQYLTDNDNNEDERDRMDLDDPWGLGLNLSDMNSRIRWVNRHQDDELLSDMPNYEDRTPELPSLYGWALGEDDPAYELLQEWFANDSELERGVAQRRHARREPSSGRTLSQHLADAHGGSGQHQHRPHDNMVPTETLLQSVRRHPRFARTRTLHHYILDRDRDREPDDRDRSTASSSRAYRFLPTTTRGEPQNLTHNDLRSRLRAHRQMYLNHPPNRRLKETIKYLERLRYSSTLEERISSAAAVSYFSAELFAHDEDDFILDTSSIAPPAECSWFRPGMVFSGSQRAARTTDTLFSHRPHAINDPIIVNGSEGSRLTVHTSNGRRYLSHDRPRASKDEDWPVTVTIHSINYDDMTLTGTMEAYNIPDKSTPTPDAQIITFLEGEIIDFNKHTLETGKFKADADTDSTYWRELQPFKDLTDDEVVKNLVSRKWITEELSKRWILMRWKEQCFVTPPRDIHSRQTLTISGFYYICLRRDNGQIEGLYYDPGSSPYQQLSLRPQTPKMACPSYKFR